MVERQSGPDGSTTAHLFFSPGRPERQIEDSPAPSWLAGAVDAVLSDMNPPEAPPLTVRYRVEPELAHFGTVSFEEPNGHQFGFGVADDGTEAELLLSLAEGLQEDLPESEGAWGRACPPCPGHAHPARPIVRQDVAWWTCPRDHRRIARIGQQRERSG